MPPDADIDSLSNKIIEVIARTQRVPLDSISLDSTFEQLGIDSLDGINIVFELEKEFDIDIPDEGVARLRSVRDTVDGVKQLMAAKGQTVPSKTA